MWGVWVSNAGARGFCLQRCAVRWSSAARGADEGQGGGPQLRSSWAPPCLAVVHLRPGHATAGRQLSGCGSRLTCEEGLLGIVVPRTSLSVVAGVEVTRCTWACETVVATVERVLLRACRTVRAFPGAEWWRGVLHACTRTRCRECPASWGAPIHRGWRCPPLGTRGSLFTYYLFSRDSTLGPDVDHKGAKVFGLPPQASLAKPRPREVAPPGPG